MNNRFNNKFKREKEAKHRINHLILAQNVRLVGENITPEIYSLQDALTISKKMSLDLVEISPTANPPVCKVVDYQKFIYEQKKKEKENKNASKEMKEIRFTVNTGENDVETKKKKIIEFVSKGHKVKTVLTFKGREMQHTDRGQILLLKLADDIQDIAKIEALPKLEGKNMSMMICPKKS